MTRGSRWQQKSERVNEMSKLREAAQAALEELIASESNAWNVINDLEAALAEPAIKESLTVAVQERMHPEIKKMYEDYFDKCFRESSAPPRREFVGLTEDEIPKLHHEIKAQLMGTYKTEDIYRAIEAKLKEKNT